MATPTTAYEFQKPAIGADRGTWGDFLNANFDLLDDLLSGVGFLNGTEITGGTFTGNGAGLTALNGTQVTTGTVAAARIGDLDAAKTTTGVFAVARIPDLSASKITSGTVADARLPTNIARTSGFTMTGEVDFTSKNMLNVGRLLFGATTAGNYATYSDAFGFTIYQDGVFAARLGPVSHISANLSVNGSITAGTLVGSGAAITDLSGSNIATGTVAEARISNAIMRTAGDTMTGDLNMSGKQIINAGPISFDSTGTAGDYIDWATTQGLNFFENGVFVARVGTDSKFQHLVQMQSGLKNTYLTTIGNSPQTTGGEYGSYITNDGQWLAAAYDKPAFDVARVNANGSIAIWRKGPNIVGSIGVTGTTTTYATSSDYRLKENITPIEGADDIILALNPVTYTFKSDGSWMDGFIAHEVATLLPTAVQGEYDGEEMQALDYSRFTPLLVAALQSALNRISALEAAA